MLESRLKDPGLVAPYHLLGEVLDREKKKKRKKVAQQWPTRSAEPLNTVGRTDDGQSCTTVFYRLVAAKNFTRPPKNDQISPKGLLNLPSREPMNYAIAVTA